VSFVADQPEVLATAAIPTRSASQSARAVDLPPLAIRHMSTDTPAEADTYPTCQAANKTVLS